jgi:hypothetical protein
MALYILMGLAGVASRRLAGVTATDANRSGGPSTSRPLSTDVARDAAPVLTILVAEFPFKVALLAG